MKLVLALLGISAMVGIAVPVHAEPAGGDRAEFDDAAFLGSLLNSGISYNNPDQAITAGKAVCGLIDNGASGLEVIKDLKTYNPALTTDQAAQFAAMSAKSYCPHQLTQRSNDSTK
jgi:Protein of unknown function (DUF732)